MQTLMLTLLALTAFAGNSILCRAALGGGAIGAASFSSLRLLSGAVTLWLLLGLRRRRPTFGGSWLSAAYLCLYAVPFSFAYESLSTGTGALLLFGAVQATMLIGAVLGGERPGRLQWLGLVIALGGVVYLMLPGVSAPDPLGASLMSVAGISWGLYSLRGRKSADSLADTTGNFLRSLPMVALVGAANLEALHTDAFGAVLAVASGSLASGVGYAIWYAALPRLSSTAAATVQLLVPVLAGAGGVMLMGETVTLRLGIASVPILGGVALAVLKPRPMYGRSMSIVGPEPKGGEHG